MRQPVEVEVFTPRRKPHLAHGAAVILKQGKRVRRTATLYHIQDPKTHAHHHDSLSIETSYFRQDAWCPDEKKSVTLGEGEVDALTDFLLANRSGAADKNGHFLLVNKAGAGAELMRLIEDLDVTDKADALAAVLRRTAERPALLKRLVARLAEDDCDLAATVATMNLEVCRRVVARLERMINDPIVTEHDYQKLLETNPWCFGSEYSCILERRRWTRDEVFDFVPRRTSDDRIELIEIKTPLDGKALFNVDTSHRTLYPAMELSKVIAQAENYLERLDRERNTILANDHIDVAKACVKIIIGRDGSEAQRAALHRHTSHLIRIDIITFDGLLRIAKRVLSYLDAPVSEDDDGNADIPF